RFRHISHDGGEVPLSKEKRRWCRSLQESCGLHLQTYHLYIFQLPLKKYGEVWGEYYCSRKGKACEWIFPRVAHDEKIYHPSSGYWQDKSWPLGRGISR